MTLGVMGVPLMAHASHPAVQEATRAYARGAPAQALKALDSVEGDPALSEEDLVLLHWYRGASLHALGRYREADDAFDHLVALRPLYEPNKLEASPALRKAFAARAELHQRHDGVILGAPRFDGPWLTIPLWRHAEKVGFVVVQVRAAEDTSFVQHAFRVEGNVARGLIVDRELLSRSSNREMIELVLEARSATQVPLARSGDPRHPLILAVPESQRRALLDHLDPPKVVTAPDPEPVVASPPPPVAVTVPPTPPVPRRDGPPFALGLSGLLLATGGLLGSAAVLGLLVSATSYALMFLHPRYAGAQVSTSYRVLSAAWLAGMVAVAVLVPVGLGLGSGGVGAGVVGVGELRWEDEACSDVTEVTSRQ
ncbi:MAG: hypothetical protein AB2A00_23685 [Myxococcota bacterium]